MRVEITAKMRELYCWLRHSNNKYLDVEQQWQSMKFNNSTMWHTYLGERNQRADPRVLGHHEAQRCSIFYVGGSHFVLWTINHAFCRRCFHLYCECDWYNAIVKMIQPARLFQFCLQTRMQGVACHNWRAVVKIDEFHSGTTTQPSCNATANYRVNSLRRNRKRELVQGNNVRS